MPTVEDIINTGFLEHQNGHFEEAEISYKEALSLDCENAEVCNLMGLLKLQQNDVNSAIDWIEKAINRQPCEYFYETLFQAYIRNKDFNKIILTNFKLKESIIYKERQKNSTIELEIFMSLMQLLARLVATFILFIQKEVVYEQFKFFDITGADGEIDPKLYPYHLKERISGPYGHLSNETAGYLLAEMKKVPQCVFLAHLSEENNRPLLALNTVKDVLTRFGSKQNIDIYVARLIIFFCAGTSFLYTSIT